MGKFSNFKIVFIFYYLIPLKAQGDIWYLSYMS
jgi:hypothetical protein